jgi:hypothetical protein
MATHIRRKSLWMDVNQGETKSGRAFGFIGTNDTDDYQGWFFTWPSDRAVISTVAERNSVLNSLDADETCPNNEQIPYAWARQKLEKYLKHGFDLRKKD